MHTARLNECLSLRVLSFTVRDAHSWSASGILRDVQFGTTASKLKPLFVQLADNAVAKLKAVLAASVLQPLAAFPRPESQHRTRCGGEGLAQ